MEIISSENYKEIMDLEVCPYLAKRVCAGTFETLPGQTLYYERYTADEPKADLVLLHGYSEGIGKYKEMVYYFLRSGCSVWQLQQREHGLSYRSTDDPALIQIDDYRDMIKDVHRFVSRIVKPQADPDLPLYLYGHSMGGGISACYLEKFPQDFSKAVLSSPMLELDNGNIPVWVARTAAGVLAHTGKGSTYMPGSHPFTGENNYENSNSVCKPRYDYWFEQMKEHPEYQMCITSYGTALELLHITECALTKQNCDRVTAQVLLFQAGRDGLVKPGGQDLFLEHIGDKGRKVVVPDAKHEIYLSTDEIMDAYWKEIAGFFGL